jgi:uncharacterized protein (DUF427 family)
MHPPDAFLTTPCLKTLRLWEICPMSLRVRELLFRELDELRYEPIDKRIRATLGGEAVVDTTRALVVWEPKRVVPSYAVPVEDVRGEVARAAASHGAPVDAPRLAGRPVYDPSVPFAVHTAPGEPVTIAGAAGFELADSDLDGYVVLDFDGFDAWYEEDEPNVGHPRDPFHRIDIVHGSRHVRVESGGHVLADSTAPVLLFEPPLPVRYYLPPDDVALDLLEPSATRTTCAYKGHTSSYWALDGRDVAWTYAEPLREAAEVTGLIAFFNERVDIAVDGEPLARPQTPWSR